MSSIQNLNKQFSTVLKEAITVSLNFIINENIFKEVYKHNDYEYYLLTGECDGLKYLAILDNTMDNNNTIIFADGNILNMYELKEQIRAEFRQALGYTEVIGEYYIFSYSSQVYGYNYCSFIYSGLYEEVSSIIYLFGDECPDYISYFSEEEVELYCNILFNDLKRICVRALYELEDKDIKEMQLYRFYKVKK